MGAATAPRGIPERQLLLQDGNHRYEALVRAGASHAWVLIYFDNPDEREAFSRQAPLP